MINPVAYYDALALGERIGDLIEGFSRPELHLLAYAACLLSLYEGQPAAEWGYEFVSTERGLPFSQDINAAIDFALNIEHIRPDGPLMVLSDEGSRELNELRTLENNSVRERYIAGAADCLLVFSPGNVREAFNYDQTIRYLRNGHRTDWLLTDPVVDRLYANFRQLREALNYEAHDLSVPMVSWLKYLILTGRTIPDDHRTN